MGRWAWKGQDTVKNIAGESSWSSYWWGDYVSFDDDVIKREKRSANDVDLSRLFKLQNIRNGIANFVKILSGKDIPVHFSSGNQSKTNGEVVIISASSDPREFDAMVGVALHEASHVLLSTHLFAFAEVLMWYMANGVANRAPAFGDNVNSLCKFFKKYETGHPFSATIIQDLHMVLNVIEDRHIDSYVYRTAPGYRPYYEEMYAKYFYTPEVFTYLNSTQAREPTLSNYFHHLINLHHPSINLDALSGLREIAAIVDLPTISRYDNMEPWERFHKFFYDNTVLPFNGTLQDCVKSQLQTSGKSVLQRYFVDPLPPMIEDAVKILTIIYENGQYNATRDWNRNDSTDLDESGDPLPDLPNYDSFGEGSANGEPRELNESEMKRISKALKKQQRFVLDKQNKKQLEEDEAAMMRDLEASKARLESVDVQMPDGSSQTKFSAPVLVYPQVTSDLLARDVIRGISGYSNDFSKASVIEGLRFGQVLAHRLRIMNDESTMKYTRQDHGRIDKRLIASLGIDNEKVFSSEHIVRIKPVMVDVSLDASGSMQGEKWHRAIKLAAALCYVSSKVKNMRVRVNVRSTGRNSSGGIAIVAVIYDSATDTLDKVRTMWPRLAPVGETPEGLCFAAMLTELLEKVKQPRHYLINISDGEPAFSTNDFNYSGKPAHLHTQSVVKKIKQAGIKVLSYFVGAALYRHEGFKTMYGSDARFVDTSQVMDIAKTLNALFLE